MASNNTSDALRRGKNFGGSTDGRRPLNLNYMKTLLSLLVLTLIATLQSFAGPEPLPIQPVKTVVEQPAAYNHFQLSLLTSGLYTITPYHDDRYIGHDHAFGGTLTAAYFFNQYLGVGLSASGYDTKSIGSNTKFVGTLPVEVTIQYPVFQQLTVFGFIGAGPILNGGNSKLVEPKGGSFGQKLRFEQQEHDVKLDAEVGVGARLNISKNWGAVIRASFNKIDRPQSNYVLIEAGPSFSF